MRVLVVSDTIAPLSSAGAGAQLAAGWDGQERVVVPIGEAGQGWLQATADQLGEPVGLMDHGDDVVAMRVAGGDTVAVGIEAVGGSGPIGIDVAATSAALGRAVRAALTEAARPRRLVVDLTGSSAMDAGAGFLAACGAVGDAPLDAGIAGLAAVDQVDLRPVRELLAGIELVGVVPHAAVGSHLLGLRGIISLTGREHDVDTATMLAADEALARFVARADPDTATDDGSGACGGLGWAIRALGGRLTTGPQETADRVGLSGTCAAADLIVTGCTSYDFASRGGGVVAAVAGWAEAAMTPCVVIAGEVLIGSREMRTMGIEAAYPVWSADAVRGDDAAAEIRSVAQRVARSWTW